MDIISSCPLCGNPVKINQVFAGFDAGRAYAAECENPLCRCRLCRLIKKKDGRFSKAFHFGRLGIIIYREPKGRFVFLTEEKRAAMYQEEAQDWILEEATTGTEEETARLWNLSIKLTK